MRGIAKARKEHDLDMKKLISVTALCALVVGLLAAPGALGVKSPKQVASTVTVSVTPNPVVAGAPATASGNVQSNSSCRKNRTVVLEWVDTSNVATPAGTATTRPNGDYTAAVTAPTTIGTYTLRATVQGPVLRRVGKKKGEHAKRGRQFSCNASAPASSSPVIVSAA
jgi:hypothetical protein